ANRRGTKGTMLNNLRGSRAVYAWRRMFLERLAAALTFCLLCSAGQNASAQRRDPFAGPGRYPEYRNLSGLSGGGYGLNADGYGSLSGPTALSTPIGYVLGRDQFRFQGAQASFTGSPEFGEHKSNGTGAFAYGHTF